MKPLRKFIMGGVTVAGLIAAVGLAMPANVAAQCGARYMYNTNGWCNEPCCQACHCCNTGASGDCPA
jgi:hypothetical protein